MNEEQLRFDFIILISDSKQYIEIVCNDQTERFIFNELIKQARYITS